MHTLDSFIHVTAILVTVCNQLIAGLTYWQLIMTNNSYCTQIFSTVHIHPFNYTEWMNTYSYSKYETRSQLEPQCTEIKNHRIHMKISLIVWWNWEWYSHIYEMKNHLKSSYILKWKIILSTLAFITSKRSICRLSNYFVEQPLYLIKSVQ